MLKLWGRANSINVQKALLCLYEVGVPFERIEAGGQFGVVNTPEYLARNPNGRVPLLDEDGFELWESNAIVRYLSAKHSAGKLYPDDLRVRADADRWMDWQQTVQAPAMLAAFWGLIRTPAEKRDQAAITASIEASAKAMTMLDKALAGRAYIAGDSFTMGDIPISAGAHRWLNLPIQRPALTNVEGWYKRVMARPAAQKVLTAPIT